MMMMKNRVLFSVQLQVEKSIDGVYIHSKIILKQSHY